MKDDLILKLKKEMSELDFRLSKLHTFLARDDAYDVVGEHQYNLMFMQMDAMRIYSGVLYLRIKDLEGRNEN